jgi:hypothetical protein
VLSGSESALHPSLGVTVHLEAPDSGPATEWPAAATSHPMVEAMPTTEAGPSGKDAVDGGGGGVEAAGSGA